MILSYTELVELVNAGVIDAPLSAVNAASIDVRLGSEFMFEVPYAGLGLKEVNLAAQDKLLFAKRKCAVGSSFFIDPGEFCLAHTMEIFNLPDDISAHFMLRSSMARNGLNQLTAVWCDAGWNNSVLTLELSNVTQFHRLLLTAGMRIGQMVFHRHTMVPAEQSYSVRGHYNGDSSVSAAHQ